jgi:hypothetical protein
MVGEQSVADGVFDIVSLAMMKQWESAGHLYDDMSPKALATFSAFTGACATLAVLGFGADADALADKVNGYMHRPDDKPRLEVVK